MFQDGGREDQVVLALDRGFRNIADNRLVVRTLRCARQFARVNIQSDDVQP